MDSIPKHTPRRYSISGMTCEHCEKRVREALEAVPGVASASVDLGSGLATVSFSASVDDAALIAAVESKGYGAAPAVPGSRPRRLSAFAGFLAALAGIIAFGWALRHAFGIDLLAFIPELDASATLGALFFAGLLTTFHCAGMCGAMALGGTLEAGRGNLTQSTRREDLTRSSRRPRSSWFAALVYNAARVASYAVVGVIVGAAGSVLSPGPAFRGAVQFVAGCAMLLLAARMLGLLSFHLPKLAFVPRVPSAALRHSTLRAAVLGLATGLMPCGPLQAMQLWALGSGSAVRGALGMAAFGLGTAPLLFVFGAVASSLAKRRVVLSRIAAALLVALAAGMLLRGLRAWGIDPAPGVAAWDCCALPQPSETPTAPEPPASPFLDMAPGADGFVSVPFARIRRDALFVNVPAADASAPAVQLIAIRDDTGRARIAFNTCQACNPSPRAFFAQRADGRLVCQNCGNDFGPEAVGAAARGCNPAAIPGVREASDALLVPAAALDAARPAFSAWAGPRH